MTQKTKMERLEKAFERKKPYRVNAGIFKVGLETLVYLWQCITTYQILDKDGSSADVDWVAEIEPSEEDITELAELVSKIDNVDVQWEELQK